MLRVYLLAGLAKIEMVCLYIDIFLGKCRRGVCCRAKYQTKDMRHSSMLYDWNIKDKHLHCYVHWFLFMHILPG